MLRSMTDLAVHYDSDYIYIYKKNVNQRKQTNADSNIDKNNKNARVGLTIFFKGSINKKRDDREN